MTEKTLILDADGVLLDYVGALLAYMGSRGHRAAVARERIDDYSMLPAFPSLSAEDILDCCRAFSMDPSFAAVPAMPGAREALAGIRARVPEARLVCVTSGGDHPDVVARRAASLSGFPLDEVLCLPFGARKAEVFRRHEGGAVVVDDLPHHLADAEAAGHFGVLMHQPYNAHHETAARVMGWGEAEERICRLLAGPGPLLSL